MTEGRTAVSNFDLFDTSQHRTRLAGQFAGELPAAFVGLGSRQPQRLSRTDRLALIAAKEAIGHADLVAEREVGVFFGSTTGGMLEAERFFDHLTNGTGHAPSAILASHQCNNPADAIARCLNLSGPVETISSACSASTMAIESALQSLRAGEVEVALAGGADALCRLTYSGFNAMRAVDERPCRPYRADRDGLSVGEGAVVLVLVTLERARARRALPMAELLGAGSSADAYHMTAPDPEGSGLARAMRAALDDAGLCAADVDFVNLHGTGTPQNDAAEWRALQTVFGERAAELPATSSKGAVGHLLGGCGGLEAVVTVLCLNAGLVHPTAGDGPVDPATPLDLVLTNPRRLERCDTALSTSMAFGGANAAILFARWSEER
jgi:3-oxoacyl-(acyl-carrier-protein) synthase